MAHPCKKKSTLVATAPNVHIQRLIARSWAAIKASLTSVLKFATLDSDMSEVSLGQAIRT